MITQNWDLNITLRISADEEKDLVALLREVARRIKKGETSGGGNYCAGTYDFETKRRYKSRANKSQQTNNK
jgi:hypothetical protein